MTPNAHPHKHKHVPRHARMHALTHARANTIITQTHTHAHARTRTHTHTHTHTNSHTHPNSHSCIHTHTFDEEDLLIDQVRCPLPECHVGHWVLLDHRTTSIVQAWSIEQFGGQRQLHRVFLVKDFIHSLASARH